MRHGHAVVGALAGEITDAGHGRINASEQPGPTQQVCSPITHLTKQHPYSPHEVLDQAMLHVLKFSSEDCGTCHRMSHYDEL
ncbi:MAG: hypothetical protein FJ051_10320, partial [Cyanobacteria bacterium M_surface_9_m1_291]|nr:hypothetical protein [Cyanobacteria bacterium M_surface_9_m1_291]